MSRRKAHSNVIFASGCSALRIAVEIKEEIEEKISNIAATPDSRPERGGAPALLPEMGRAPSQAHPESGRGTGSRSPAPRVPEGRADRQLHKILATLEHQEQNTAFSILTARPNRSFRKKMAKETTSFQEIADLFLGSRFQEGPIANSQEIFGSSTTAMLHIVMEWQGNRAYFLVGIILLKLIRLKMIYSKGLEEEHGVYWTRRTDPGHRRGSFSSWLSGDRSLWKKAFREDRASLACPFRAFSKASFLHGTRR